MFYLAEGVAWNAFLYPGGQVAREMSIAVQLLGSNVIVFLQVAVLRMCLRLRD